MANIVLVVLSALCVVPCIVSSHFMADPLLLKGSVYCDTCRCGYETSASKPLFGAVVRVECIKRTDNSKITYTKEAVTDSNGRYQILVHGDTGDDLCDARLVKSSDPDCSTPNAGRDRARVILTRNNGMATNARFANSLGFLKKTPLPSCPLILQQYVDQESEN